MRVDVEEASSRRHTAAGVLLIPGESNIDHLRVLLSQAGDLPAQDLPIRIPEGKLPAFLRNGHKLHKDHGLAAPVSKHLQEGIRRDLVQVLRRHGHRRTENQAAPMELIHVGDQSVIDALSPARIGCFALALDAHDGDQIAAAVKQVEVAVVQKGTVCQDGKEDIRLFPGCLDDILA